MYSEPPGPPISPARPIAWGDGHSDTATAANGGIVDNGDGTFSYLFGSHTYSAKASGLMVEVTIDDEGGASVTDKRHA